MRTLTASITGLLAAALAGAGPAAAAGLPQLDASKFSPQIVWLVICFAVLYVLMSRFALPRISHVLEERQDRIDDDLQRAGEVKTEAEAAAEAYETSLAEARAGAGRVIVDAAHALSEEAAKRDAELTATLAADIEAAEARITEARATALANIRDVAEDVARQAAERLAGEPMDEAAVTAAVDAAVEERG